MKTTAADCEFIAHYLTSIGYAGHLKTVLREDDVFSFDDIKEALIVKDEEIDILNIDLRPHGITGSLHGCISRLDGACPRWPKDLLNW